MGHVPTKNSCGADPRCFVVQLDAIILDHSILLRFGHVQVDNPRYIGIETIHLYLCHILGSILSFQRINNDYLYVQPAVLTV